MTRKGRLEMISRASGDYNATASKTRNLFLHESIANKTSEELADNNISNPPDELTSNFDPTLVLALIFQWILR
jgi:hypothetical protein